VVLELGQRVPLGQRVQRGAPVGSAQQLHLLSVHQRAQPLQEGPVVGVQPVGQHAAQAQGQPHPGEGPQRLQQGAVGGVHGPRDDLVLLARRL